MLKDLYAQYLQQVGQAPDRASLAESGDLQRAQDAQSNWLADRGVFLRDKQFDFTGSKYGLSPDQLMQWWAGPGQWENLGDSGFLGDDPNHQYWLSSDPSFRQTHPDRNLLSVPDQKDFWGKYGFGILSAGFGAVAGAASAAGAAGGAADALGTGLADFSGGFAPVTADTVGSAGGFSLAGGDGIGTSLAGGTSMDGFFSDILDLFGPDASDFLSSPSFDFGGGTSPVDSSNIFQSGGYNLLPPEASGFGPSDIWNLPSSQGSDWLSKLKSLIPSGDASSLSKLLLGNGGLLGGGGSSLLGDGLLGSAASIAPSLAAINYARNLGQPDTSRLTSTYDSLDPNSFALPYDMQTAKGRGDLTSSLTNRGVYGSSFGNSDMVNYDTLRDLGRGNLLSQGAGQRASIASQILAAETAQQKNKLDLYGRALLGLSGSVNPASSSSTLAKLLTGGLGA